MNVFLAWSGESSHRTALLLHEWLPDVLQRVKAFLSSEDIDKGRRWQGDLAQQVEVADFAIICLTPDNLKSEWIHFEAGAVSRQAREGRVSSLLVGVKAQDVRDPLGQFQNTPATETEVRKLVGTLNKLLGAEALSERQLSKAFETHWPELESGLKGAVSTISAPAVPKRPTEEVMAEILENTREQGRLLNSWLLSQQRAPFQTTLNDSNDMNESAATKLLREAYSGGKSRTISEVLESLVIKAATRQVIDDVAKRGHARGTVLSDPPPLSLRKKAEGGAPPDPSLPNSDDSAAEPPKS